MSKEIASVFPVKHTVTEMTFKVKPHSQTLSLQVPAKITSGITKYSNNDYTVETTFHLKNQNGDVDIKVVLETSVVGIGDFNEVNKLISSNITNIAILEITKIIQRCSFALGYPAILGPEST
jgi:hypothetical protein